MERQGLAWWEIDVTHYVLRLFSYSGLVWELRPPTGLRDLQSHDEKHSMRGDR
jgi:fatty-acid desaturase